MARLRALSQNEPQQLEVIAGQIVEEAARRADRQLWVEGDWVFTNKLGRPVVPNTDYHAWKALLRKAGVAMPGCTKPGIRRRRCCWCWVYLSGR